MKCPNCNNKLNTNQSPFSKFNYVLCQKCGYEEYTKEHQKIYNDNGNKKKEVK